jgi:transposase
MLCWEEFVELRSLHERGWSVSAIARHLGKDRKTVRRYLADPDARPGVRKPAGKLLDPYAAYVMARLEDNPHLAGTVLDRELSQLGFVGSYRTLARHVAGVRPDCVACHGPEPAESVVMRHRPGAAQADWSPFSWTPAGSAVEVEVQLFAIQLCRPQLLFAEFFERQSWAHLAAGHVAAFDYFAGVPTEVGYDRTAQVFRARSTEPTPAFADFAASYGFKLVPCVVGRSRSKGQIERAFRYVATWFFATADAATLAELNRVLRRWLDEVANTRTSADVPPRRPRRWPPSGPICCRCVGLPIGLSWSWRARSTATAWCAWTAPATRSSPATSAPRSAWSPGRVTTSWRSAGAPG